MGLALKDTLGKIGRPRGHDAREQRRHEREVHAELDPAVRQCGDLIKQLHVVIDAEVRPFLEEFDAFEIPDIEIQTCLFDLREKICKKSNELAHWIDEAKKVNWDQIRQTVYPNELDQMKRDALVRELSALSTGRWTRLKLMEVSKNG